MGIDYGDRNVGIAISDELHLTAQPIEIIRRKDEVSIKETVRRIGVLISEFNVSLIVLGYPKNMDGSEGFRCEKTILFKDRLHRNFKKMDIILQDERLSTAGALRHMGHMTCAEKHNSIDKMAAVFILQGYLDQIYKTNKL